jgi:hypothetical protein
MSTVLLGLGPFRFAIGGLNHLQPTRRLRSGQELLERRWLEVQADAQTLRPSDYDIMLQTALRAKNVGS